MGKTVTEEKPPVQAPPVPPLEMCTARLGELRVGPMRYDTALFGELKRIALGNETTEAQLDAVLEREGYKRRFAWWRDGAGAWTLVVHVGKDSSDGEVDAPAEAEGNPT